MQRCGRLPLQCSEFKRWAAIVFVEPLSVEYISDNISAEKGPEVEEVGGLDLLLEAASSLQDTAQRAGSPSALEQEQGSPQAMQVFTGLGLKTEPESSTLEVRQTGSLGRHWLVHSCWYGNKGLTRCLNTFTSKWL